MHRAILRISESTGVAFPAQQVHQHVLRQLSLYRLDRVRGKSIEYPLLPAFPQIDMLSQFRVFFANFEQLYAYLRTCVESVVFVYQQWFKHLFLNRKNFFS